MVYNIQFQKSDTRIDIQAESLIKKIKTKKEQCLYTYSNITFDA